MRPERRLVRIVLGYIFVCLVLVVFWHFERSQRFVLDLLLEDYGYVLVFLSLTAALTVFSTYYLVNFMQQDRTRMIKNLVESNGKKEHEYQEVACLEHHYNMARNEVLMLEAERSCKQALFTEYQAQSRELEQRCDAYKHRNNTVEELTTEAKALFQAVANATDDYVWVTDSDGGMLYYNDKLLERVPRLVHGWSTPSILMLDGDDCGLFERRDFSNIHLKLYGEDRTDVSLSTKRMFQDNKVESIIYYAENIYQSELVTHFIRKNGDLNFLFEIFDILGKDTMNINYINNIIEKICMQGKLQSISIRLVDASKCYLEHYTHYAVNSQVVSKNRIPIQGTSMGEAFEAGKVIVFNSPKDHEDYQEPAVQNALKKGNHIAYFPLKVQDLNMGVIAVVNNQRIDEDTRLAMSAITSNLAIALEKILLYDELKQSYFQVVEAFLTAFEMKTDYMKGHARRVASICRLMTGPLFYDIEDVDNIYSSALLHDIGKMKFDEKSYEHSYDLHRHGAWGRAIMEGVGLSEDVLLGIEMHHDDYISEKGIQPLYPQFVRLANDFDIYFFIKPEYERAVEFVDRVCKRKVGEYSPNLVSVLEYIVKNNFDEIIQLYGGS